MPRKSTSKAQREGKGKGKKMENDSAREDSAVAPAADDPAPATSSDPPAPAPAAESSLNSKPSQSLPPDKDGKAGAAAATNEADLKKSVDRLEKENLEYHNKIAELENDISELNEQLKAARTSVGDLTRQVHLSEEAKTEVNAQEQAAQAQVRVKETEKDKVKEQLQQEKQKSHGLQELAETLQADLADKENQLKRLRDISDDSEIRLRAAEQDLLNSSAELDQSRSATEFLSVIDEKLSSVFEEMGKELTPQALIKYIDDLEEGPIAKSKSGINISDYNKAAGHAKGGLRKTSVSDELQKASESMEDDEDEEWRKYAGELESQLLTLGKEKDEWQKKAEKLDSEKDAKRKDSRVASPVVNGDGVGVFEEVKTEAGSESPQGLNIKVETGEETKPQEGPKTPETKVVPQVETITVEKPVARPFTFKELLIQAPWWLKVLLVVGFILCGWNYYLTWTERRMWQEANDHHWLTGEIYHKYGGRQPASPSPYFTIAPNPFINWIERDLLGYLDTLPG